MTLPASGAISLGSLKGEFGGNASPKLSDYYKGKGFNQEYNPNLPSSGPISLSKFYGSAKQTNTTFKSSGGEIVYSGGPGDKIIYPNGTTLDITSNAASVLTRMAGIHTIVHSTAEQPYIARLAGDGLTEIISITNAVNVWGLEGRVVINSPDYSNMTIYGRTNLTTVPSVLPGNITSLGSFFYRVSKLTTNITGWNVGKVTNISNMFGYASTFNQPIGSWNVENVTNMDDMFQYASSFNQPLNKWCVKNIPKEPTDFARSANKFQSANKPVWGTCPTT